MAHSSFLFELSFLRTKALLDQCAELRHPGEDEDYSLVVLRSGNCLFFHHRYLDLRLNWQCLDMAELVPQLSSHSFEQPIESRG